MDGRAPPSDCTEYTNGRTSYRTQGVRVTTGQKKTQELNSRLSQSQKPKRAFNIEEV